MAKYHIKTVEGIVLEVSIPETSATDTKATNTPETDTSVANTEAIDIPVPNEQTTEFEPSVVADFPGCPEWISNIARLTDRLLSEEEPNIVRDIVAKIRDLAWLMQWKELVDLADAFTNGNNKVCLKIVDEIADKVLDRITKQKKFAMIDAIKEVASKYLGKSAIFVTTEEIVEAIQ